jgi:EPS-associated MarR family transcriptional regulator
MLTDEARYKILRQLEAKPESSQRELADALGISLGKINYCLQALIDKGSLKVGNFSRCNKKRRYLYKLTPKGIEDKAKVTARFLRRKMAEYEALKCEIDDMQKELEATGERGR